MNKREVKVAAVQFACTRNVDENIATADKYVREAAKAGANIILIPELFERQYFCQERRYDYYDFATSIEDNKAVNHFIEVAKELSVVVIVSVYEKDITRLFNSVVVIDADGTNLGTYRKTHIPDDHYYQEKFYFTPGDTGFMAFETKFAKIGVGICWDQWFPETARSMALLGAELLFYPTAIGSEPILELDSMPHWRRVMQGHSAANLMPVIAANRIGREDVTASEANGGQTSSLNFYGSSFITDNTGEIVEELGRDVEGVICHSFDLDELEKDRVSWGLFRDRRPDMYKIISEK
ncbi:N-carbamoylputrescine amidase [Lachnospira multipara]|uniref:N-carbamoylputrescine amidase n=1 Tax=Lachnospira multipara TaxID=28051 RepID=UPI000426FFF3|nr:N-carbamoylputrescine amidase [Lachnospira multipara]